MASKNRETEIALQKLAYTEKQAAELTRLRKIESAARALTVDFNGDVLAFCTELSKLRSSVETETDG